MNILIFINNFKKCSFRASTIHEVFFIEKGDI